MCGIVGIAGVAAAPQSVVEGLKRLEYRGYDSAGLAAVTAGGLQRVRAKGKIAALEEALAAKPLQANVAIGHTRWATHGIPSEANAHPHATDKVAVVHNGIIENYKELKAELLNKNFTFESETDSEVIPVLLTDFLAHGFTPRDAVAETIKKLKGAYAIAILFKDEPEVLYAVRHGAPLAVGRGENGLRAVGSDASAVAHVVNQLAYLEDGDMAQLTASAISIFDKNDEPVTRVFHAIASVGAVVGKEPYRHFMQKEIFEQPAVVAETYGVYYNPALQRADFAEVKIDAKAITRLNLVACGTSYYAASVAAYWFEQIAKIPTQVDIASEFRYREPILDPKGLSIVISQSGETADTLAALRYIKQTQPCLAVVNVPHSTIAREASGVLMTYAGPEIGVASTKAFTTQLSVLACLCLHLAQARGTLNDAELKAHYEALLHLPALMSETLELDKKVEAIAHHISHARDVLYLGRGTSMPIAFEGALKLKEISYIHAEAYAAGEMKHGPIALIDETVPIVAIAPSDALFEKTASNLQEAAARGGKIILITDQAGENALGDLAAHTLVLPDAHPFIQPMLYAIPAQLLAYHTAVIKGTDVDQPRNLAKSVTVE